MSARTFTTLRSFGRVVVPALTVWLSGLACLLSCAAACYGAGAPGCRPDVESPPTVAVAMHGKAHSCCVPRTARAETPDRASEAMTIRQDDAETGVCCFLTTRPTMTAPLPVPVSVAAALPASELSPPVPDRDPSPRAVHEVPALSRGDTYLRCCVLLI